MFAPFLAAGLWELVIHLFCGSRHRAHRARESRHTLLYRFFKAGEAEGLAHGTWRAPVAAARARAAARRIAKHVPREERDAELGAWLASAQYAQQVRVSVAAIAARTAQDMQSDLVAHDVQVQIEAAPAVQTPVADAEVQPVAVAPQVQKEVQDYDTRVAHAVQRETSAILSDLQPAPAPRASTTERRDIVRAILQKNRAATGSAVHEALMAAGHAVSKRTAYNDRDAVLEGLEAA